MNTELSKLRSTGFSEPVKVEILRESCRMIPNESGVYVVLRLTETAPVFLVKGSGGLHNGIDLNYTIEDLQGKWVEDTNIMYIGKTDASLRKRIRTYMCHGMGKDAAHRGGRSIWQLSDAADLFFVWKQIDVKNESGICSTEEIERQMLCKFQQGHNGKLPFANRK